MQQTNQHKYLLKYRNLDQLFLEVEEDLQKWNVNGLIDRSTLIKVVQHCNANLGLKIQPDKEVVIDIDNYYGELPADFYKFNFGALCTGYEITQPADFKKRELKEIETLDPTLQCQVDPCQVKRLCGKSYVMTETQKFETITITQLTDVSLKNTSREICADDCPNLGKSCVNEISIKGHQVDTNFKSGSLYFCYTGFLESEDGQLMVLDHPLINPYYEAAVKYKIFDLLEDNGEQVEGLAAKWRARYKEEKWIAEGIVSTPEYEEVGRMHNRHRARIYNTYYRMIY